ncbi:MAG TPA: hypothetical protein VGO67_07360 [Verrucomicrobiae bacterium]
MAAGSHAVMQFHKFFRAVAFALETRIEASLDFGLPSRLVNTETLAKVFRQFQTLIHRESVHSALKFDNAHDWPAEIFKYQGTASAVDDAPYLDAWLTEGIAEADLFCWTVLPFGSSFDYDH